MPSPAGGTSHKSPRQLRRRRQEHYLTDRMFDTNASAGSLSLSNSTVGARIHLRAGIAICCLRGRVRQERESVRNSLPLALSKE